uniref:Uncharacterized protein n=1 Tax=Fagus sylvatica TaxID=28930 RepID=A0A2N9IJ59_FAGSY
MGSTSGHEITHPITVILDGPASYHAWSQNMTVFLKGRRLWRYVTGDIGVMLLQLFRLMILRLVLRSGKASNAGSFPGSLTPLCLPLAVSFLDWKQVKRPGLSWPLAAADPPLRYAEDIDLFAKYKDRRRFTQFMMGLREDFEPTRAALLSRSPLPSLDAAVKELISEENRRPHHHLSSSDVVLATPRPPSSSDRSRRFCTYCQKPSHDITECYRKKKDDKRKQHHLSSSYGLFLCCCHNHLISRLMAFSSWSCLFISSSIISFSRFFGQIMPKNIMINLSSPFWILMAPFPTIHVPIPLNKMVVPNANFVTFLMLCVPSSYLPLSLSVFGVKRLSLPFTPSIAFPHLLLTRNLPLSYFMTKSQTIPLFEYSVVFVLSLFLPMNETNLNQGLGCVAFLGYGISQKGFRCYDPISRRLRISRHVEFWEHQTFSSRQHFPFISSSMTPIFTDPSIDLYPDPVRDSTQPPSSSDVPSLVLSPAAGSPDSDPASSAPSESPTDIRRSTRQAMADELDALHKTHTWDMTTLPPGKSAVGCKWVYKIKTRADGSVERYKARLVARGFTQEYGIDYEETFAPVARLTSVRSLLAVAAVRHWPLFQMDVKNAFLNGDLLEEVYMQPPPGYPDSQNQVCRLRRALYGLKQAPRAWFAKFSSVVAQQGFTPSSYDSALFIRHTSTGITLILLYVDDMIITGDDIAGICDLQKFLSQQFEMKDLGTLSYFLGLEVTSSSDGYYLSQAKYASDLLSKAGLTDSKTVSTPLELNVKLNTTDGEPLSDATLYRQLVGSLIYLTVTRPDLAYAVHLVSQFMSAPRSTHYAAVLRILRYIKGTLFHGLHFSAQSSLELRAYADADWAGDPTDRRSTTGYCFLLGSSLISWRSKKQSVVARSSTEAEYRALADATSELLWLRWLLADMGAPQTTNTPIHCDNRSAIHIAHNDVFHERTKHIEIDCHFIRHHLQQSALHLLSVSSEDQLADVFTKSHPPGRLRDLVSKLKMASSSPPCV